MLNFTLLHIYFYRPFQYLRRSNIDRNPLSTRINVTVNGYNVDTSVNELINFVENRYPISTLNVKILHNGIKWEELLPKQQTIKGKEIVKYHIRIINFVELHYPIIVVSDLNGKIIEILDGVHRIKKAFLLKRKKIRAYIIPESDLIKLNKLCHEKL
jgi:hypothetical protein